MDFEKMSFRTPNYGDSMMGSLLNLQMSGVLCDAVLKGRNVEAKVHRVILMALDCPYFKEQLVTADLNTTMESPSIVEIDTESQVDLDCFIKELYTGCLELTTSNVRNMSNIYETLKLNNQLQFCHDFEKRLLHPPGADAISNDSSQITGLDTLDVSKVSAVVCSGSDIIKVIKVETSDDEEIHDREASKNDSETPGQICMKSEDVKDEEPVSDVQKTEVKETSTLEKEECEKTDQPQSSANPEENLTSVANHSEVESLDDSTVKSENEDDDDGMDGFEVLDEYIEDDQEDKEQTDDPPPAKKPKMITLLKCSLNDDPKRTNKAKYSCDVCRYSTNDKSNFNKHKKTHGEKAGKSDKDMLCCECGKSFASRYGLSLHMKNKHQLIFKIMCEYCGKGFNQNTSYRFHLASHKKIALDQCRFCDKKFASCGSLRRHLQTCNNMNRELFVCETCQAIFSRKYQLQEHIRGKHGEPGYACKFCSKRFGWRSSLRAHLKRHVGNLNLVSDDS